MKHFIYILALSSLIFSCKKKTDDVVFSGTLTINNPVENDTISGTPSFTIAAIASANMEMHGYHVTVYNENDQSVLFEDIQHVHASSYSISETIPYTSTDTIPMRVVIETAGNHEDEIMTKTRYFVVKP
ncbi:MAG: hypothetical protein IT221_14280 [Fluviicola sp.]|nr:hypothetical protein [Fluviicola sp.]